MFSKVLAFISYLEQQTDWIESAALTIKYNTVNGLGFSVLDLCGSIIVCHGYRNFMKTSKSWFEVLIACVLIQFGGTTITNWFILGQTPSWIMSHTAFPAFFLAYWLTFHCPYDAYWRLLSSFTNPQLSSIHVLHFIQLGAAISSGHAITSWGVDKALYNTFHVNHIRIAQSMLTCILAGTFSGCGGGILSNIFGFLRTPSFVMIKTTDLFTIGNYEVSATLTRSFILAVIYYVLVTPYNMPWNLIECNQTVTNLSCNPLKSSLIEKKTGHLIIVTLQLLHLFMKTLFNMDIYLMLSNLLQKALYISPVLHPIQQQESEDETTQETIQSETKITDISTRGRSKSRSPRSMKKPKKT